MGKAGKKVLAFALAVFSVFSAVIAIGGGLVAGAYAASEENWKTYPFDDDYLNMIFEEMTVNGELEGFEFYPSKENSVLIYRNEDALYFEYIKDENAGCTRIDMWRQDFPNNRAYGVSREYDKVGTPMYVIFQASHDEYAGTGYLIAKEEFDEAVYIFGDFSISEDRYEEMYDDDYYDAWDEADNNRKEKFFELFDRMEEKYKPAK